MPAFRRPWDFFWHEDLAEVTMGRMKQRQTALLGCILVLVTGILYWPVVRAQFMVMDDDLYITENPGVGRGFNLAGLKWAMTTTYAANWHPLTWISHQIDYSLWGNFAGGHHLTNLVFHVVNTLLLFHLLKRLTGSIWRSFAVAALFGWHPLHVESVAWIAERKDVLSTFFFLLTLWAYARYAESKVQSPKSKVQSQGTGFDSPHPTSILYCLLALFLFVLGLMSKPMLVTLPFILLLLDFWPLNRFPPELLSRTDEKHSFFIGARISVCLRRLLQFFGSRLFWEKVPFLGLALAISVVTLGAQKSAGAVKTVGEVPLLLRGFNSLSAYGHYLLGSVWPVNLCVYYPLPSKPPIVSGALSAVVMLVLTWWSLRVRRKQPWALTGWLWFVGTLVPVIGLLQVGSQARADRYTYLPFIGLFVMIVWTANSLMQRREEPAWGAITLATVGLCGLIAVARHQLGYWQDSVTLFTRAVEVTTENSFAQNNLGVALAREGRLKEATAHYAEAVRIKPNYTQARYNLGIQLASAGELDEASVQFAEALKLDPQSEMLHNNFGVILAKQEKVDAAIGHFRRAIELNPEYPKSYFNYAMALQKKGEAGLALTNYYRALALEKTWPDALDKIAFLLATCPSPECHNPAAAVKFAQEANDLTRGTVAGYLETLALAFAAAGQFSNAIATAESARAQATRKGGLGLLERLQKDTESYRLGRCPERDWRNPGSSSIQERSDRSKQ